MCDIYFDERPVRDRNFNNPRDQLAVCFPKKFAYEMKQTEPL